MNPSKVLLVRKTKAAQMKTNTALLIFARTAFEESKHKSFKASKAFFNYQNKKILRLAKKSGLNYVWIDERAQTGENFEQRYLNAIQTIFDEGFEQVISIGNDSPELSLSHFRQAIDSLKQKDMCFGPSKDGGFYLWGIKKRLFKKQNFLDFSWKTKDLLSEILSELDKKCISVSCIDTLIDLDRREDAFLLLNTGKIALQLKIILVQILNLNKDFYLVYQPYPKTRFTNVYYNKGSPLAA